MFKQIGISFALIAFGQAVFADSLTYPQKQAQDWSLINFDSVAIQETGKNVAVGFLDSAFIMTHPSLADKTGGTDPLGSNYLSPVEKDNAAYAHGTHVAAIAVGNRVSLDSGQMRGVAPDANFYGVQYLNNKDTYNGTKDDIKNFLKNGKVRVVNNSWAHNEFPNINKQITSSTSFFNYVYLPLTEGKVTTQFVLNKLKNQSYKGLLATFELAKEGILQVYSSGNEGQIAPTLNPSLATYDDDLKAWINVGALNSNNIEKNGDKFIIKPQYFDQRTQDFIGGFTSFSNLFFGSQSYSILAPGFEIGSANAYYGKKDLTSGWKGIYYPCLSHEFEFCGLSGTSQAAPFVSGAAALVAEKYPFADGRLLADIILGNANSDVQLPDMVILRSPTTGQKNDETEKFYYYNIVYTNQQDESKIKDRSQVRQDLIDKLNLKPEKADEILDHLMHDSGQYAVYLTKEELIGQGILDIEKSLTGLSKLDANRIKNSEVKISAFDKNDKQAIYTINLSDGNTEFNNNIEQVEWNQKWHSKQGVEASEDLKNATKVGLEKIGKGTLTLGGQNTYQGDTIVSGGILNLTGSIAGNAQINSDGRFELGSWGSDKQAIIEGSVLNSGTFAGIGLINGNFENRGILKAGFYDEKTQETISQNDKLTIQGTFTQQVNDAQLQLAFMKNQSGVVNSQFQATTYNITGGNLVFMPLHSKNNLITKGESISLPNVPAELYANNNLKISVGSTNLLSFTFNPATKTITAQEKTTTPQPPVNPSTPTVNPGSGSTSSGSSTPSNPSTGGGSGGSSGGSGGGSSGGSGGGSGGSGGYQAPQNGQTFLQQQLQQQALLQQQFIAQQQAMLPFGFGVQNPLQQQIIAQQQAQQALIAQQQAQQALIAQQQQQAIIQQQQGFLPFAFGFGFNWQAWWLQQQMQQALLQQQLIAQQQAFLPFGFGMQGIFAQQVQQQALLQQQLIAQQQQQAGTVRALQGVLSNATVLSSTSTAALAELDNLPSSQFNSATAALATTPTNTNIDAIDTMQKDLTIKNALFLMDPASTLGTLNTASNVFAPTAAFGDEYLGKVDDVFIKTEVSAGITYRRTDHDDYKQNSYLLDLQGKKALNDNTLLGGYIGLSHSKTEDELSDIKSNMFSLGLSLNHSFENFGVLLGASAGMSFNHYEQSIKYLSNAKSDANYKNYFANFQGGIYKSFKLSESINLTPIALVDYSIIKQDSFSQSGALAKNYEAKTTHFGRGWLGANLVYNTELDNNWKFNTSLFAFYWRKFNHKDINQNLSFVEASNQKFLANTSRSERDGFYGGVAFGASKGNKFFRISISDEKARAYNQYEIMLRAGISF